MAEYIGKEEFLEFCDKRLPKMIADPDGLHPISLEVVMVAIKNWPAADVAPVVRCKDCVHWLNEDGLDDHVCLKIYSDGAVSSYAWQDRKPYDFCSYGKRKDSDT